jgi:hypothetical protein
MGLLDDAIREHLELKRSHGADPTEVERQEREALGAPRQEAEFASASDAPATDEAAAVPAEEASEVAPEPGPEPVEPEPESQAEDPWAGDEPDDGPDEVPPGDALGHPAPAEEPESEDVLEETPDFLQETPEHDRLWFEQRPPRDFDWDK